MAPLSFAKLFSSRSSNSSNGSDRRSSLDSTESGESYVISLPSMYSVSDPLAAPAPIGSRSSSSSALPQPAEMLDDDNFAWGRPSRKQRHPSSKSRRMRS